MPRILLVFLFLTCLHASAETFNLEAGALIQETIAQAQAGDTIVLEAGEYLGDIDFLAKAITIRGVGENTVLKGTGEKPVVSFTGGELNTSILELVTITGAQEQEEISIENSSPIISSCKIIRNKSNSQASGIAITGQAQGEVAIVRNNILALNKALDRANDPHQIHIANASPVIENNTIVRGDSNGIFVTGNSSPIIVNNILAFNGRGSRGRGICLVALSQESNTDINHNLFFRNRKADILVNGADFKNIETAQLEETNLLTLTSNIHSNPRFRKLRKVTNLTLKNRSPAIEAGNPAEAFNDKDTSRNDIGFTGGKNSNFSSITLF